MKVPDAALPLSRFAAGLRLGDLPPDLVERVKRWILDTLAVTVAGLAVPVAQAALEQARAWGGAPEAALIGAGVRLPAPLSALAHGTLAHAQEFDDVHDEAIIHAGAAVLPAALAAAGAVGPVSGATLLAATVAGAEVACRLGLGAGPIRGFERSSVCGVFGAAAAAGRILGLDADRMVMALGIAGSQAAGTRQPMTEGAGTKPLQMGLAAEAGVRAAFLARRGVTGPRRVFEGEWGFFGTYNAGRYDRETLVEGLGERFEAGRLGLKPYPCCRFTHPAIDAALALRRESRIDPVEVRAIAVSVPDEPYLGVVSRPFACDGDPRVSMQFSLPYTVALALHEGRVALEHFAGKPEPKVVALADRVRVDRGGPPSGRVRFLPARVRVETVAGMVTESSVANVRGGPDRPLCDGELFAKVQACLATAGGPGAEVAAEKLAERVLSLEIVGDVDELVGCLGPRGIPGPAAQARVSA